ncbi:hypothetical protein P153DRAFT_106635 [Dothidotthia symphoricarpi CBS 119687]|uniref:Uncharacterized protein n=1 Tax=Dothidotthia symphoricarpi CBS 119687 TaxID=1392245 RepID=A0A6A6AQI0_9PLEO|nr:uncharacterized protein P153DRAFT_106635 [Dothidotthia symphoricarpi CBS 119687]KAF2134189.1 hypothetical protein P153DRAFT_106635 [Dothidotthia symphoricarpi CBS 119687]
MSQNMWAGLELAYTDSLLQAELLGGVRLSSNTATAACVKEHSVSCRCYAMCSIGRIVLRQDNEPQSGIQKNETLQRDVSFELADLCVAWASTPTIEQDHTIKIRAARGSFMQSSASASSNEIVSQHLAISLPCYVSYRWSISHGEFSRPQSAFSQPFFVRCWTEDRASQQPLQIGFLLLRRSQSLSLALTPESPCQVAIATSLGRPPS